MKTQEYIQLIKEYSKENYMQMTRPAEGNLKYPFIVPGSKSYSNCLWDWDCWLTDVAVRQIMADNDNENQDFAECEKGSVLNFLLHTREDGAMPITITSDSLAVWQPGEKRGNIHKPCIAQHIAFQKKNGADIAWVKPYLDRLKSFIGYYNTYCYHEKTGLYYWNDDERIGVDNDPCTFYRPDNSSASIYLNCLMYKELCAMETICKSLEDSDSAAYAEMAEKLKNAVNTHLWDERNGFYYSADLNLRPVDPNETLHQGMPRHWDCVLQKIDVWSGFMAMWAGIADADRAERMVKENMENTRIFRGKYGIRSLSALEPMYCIVKSGNPSCWLGPIWGITNYMCFKGLADYGFDEEAKKLALATIELFGRDLEDCGELHEYYHPDTGAGVNNPGFQNWNLLVNNMIAYLENRKRIIEF